MREQQGGAALFRRDNSPPREVCDFPSDALPACLHRRGFQKRGWESESEKVREWESERVREGEKLGE